MKTTPTRLRLFVTCSLGLFIAACGGGGSKTTTSNPVAPTVSVTPGAASITTAQSESVKVTVSGSNGVPTGSVALSSGSYTSSATQLSGGSATITVAAGVLAVGTDTLSATYAPDTASSSNYTGAFGAGSVAVAKAAPTVTVTPASASITPGASLAVLVAVSGGSGAPTATGSVTLTNGSFVSSATTLAGGGAIINVPAGTLANGSDTLAVAYTPDSAGANIYNAATGTAGVTVGIVTPTVTVTRPSTVITTQQAISVAITVSGGGANPTPTGSVALTGGGYTSSTVELVNGTATIDIPGGALAAGSDTLTAAYSPDTASSSNYVAASGTIQVTVTKITPTVTVTPASTSVNSGQDLKVTVVVAAASGDATPTGSVALSSGTYTPAATALASGSVNIDIPAGSLANGSDTLTAAYTPDTASAPIYTVANGVSAAITVVLLSTVTVNQGVSGAAITDQLLGMNLGDWSDPTDPAIVPAFKAAGIKAIRWPGGSFSDDYHWQTNSACTRPTTGAPLQPGGWADPNGVYQKVITDLEIPGGLDVALTANYGTDSTCTKGGDPTEAAAWVQYAEQHGGTVSHITVGNEEYGTWEDDLHSKPNDPTTYADAAATGYYPDIKAVDKNVRVGVSVNPGNNPDWDTIVLANAKYDFVEFHFYPQGPFGEKDSYITQQAAQDLTKNIETIKAELKTAGKPDTPIYVGEIGSVYTNPGKQSWSITQGLYAGQALGEMMNEGVSRLTWWIGFGNCNGQSGNDDASLYGWQNFGAYNVFSDGANDPTCPDAGPDGTMSPTAQAFNLFQQVAVNDESVLTATVGGDNTDVRAYAATHSGGTALVLFNLNETASQPVKITLSAQTKSSDVKMTTYSKAIYDKSKNDVWDPPTSTDLGARNLPLTLTLAPWSMNVVILK